MLLSAATLVGCGGGGGGGTVTPVSRQAEKQGVVTAVRGSFAVSGTPIQTTPTTAVWVDGGSAAGMRALKPGMVVHVKGSVDNQGTMTAAEISFVGDLEGAVEFIDLRGGTLTVLGQTVMLDDLTVFEDVTAADLTVGNIVEVSGFRQADGTLLARFVEFEAAQFEALATRRIAIKGPIRDLDPMTKTFTIGGQTVDYNAATLAPGLTLANDLVVEVHGTRPVAAGSVLVASRVEAEDETLVGHEGTDAELEGIITRFASATNFDVNGQPVATMAQTQFRNGAASDLALDVCLDVAGALDAQGVLVADRICLRLARNVKIDADVAAVDPVVGTVQLLGSAPGITVTVNASTLLLDRKNGLSPFTLDDLAVGDRVSVRASVGSGVVTAAKLERRPVPSDPTSVRLQGPITPGSAAAPTLDILGITVDATGASLFRGGHEGSWTSTEFFAALASGSDLVTVKGALDPSGVLLAQELSLQLEHEFDHEMERGSAYRYNYEQEMGHEGGHH
ncbi:MAG: hypothetical protein HZB55_09345 [Deltaproteobacteria bacterium]|nr:hypothetical protein [Deltaproteobacteria bacterium]